MSLAATEQEEEEEGLLLFDVDLAGEDPSPPTATLQCTGILAASIFVPPVLYEPEDAGQDVGVWWRCTLAACNDSYRVVDVAGLARCLRATTACPICSPHNCARALRPAVYQLLRNLVLGSGDLPEEYIDVIRELAQAQVLPWQTDALRNMELRDAMAAASVLLATTLGPYGATLLDACIKGGGLDLWAPYTIWTAPERGEYEHMCLLQYACCVLETSAREHGVNNECVASVMGYSGRGKPTLLRTDLVHACIAHRKHEQWVAGFLIRFFRLTGLDLTAPPGRMGRSKHRRHLSSDR